MNDKFNEREHFERINSMRYKRLTWIALSFFTILLVWRYVWGYCWNPLTVSCFSAPSSGDYTQHYYTWLAYAKGDLSLWIPPKFSNWTWPLSSSLVYGDPIPLAAVALAPLAKATQQNFHYFSVFSFVSMLICGGCGFAIGYKQKLPAYQMALLGIALAISPPAIRRIAGHEALSLHAIIVVAITLVILRIRTWLYWGALIATAIGIHAYFAPIVLVYALFAQLAIPREGENRLQPNKLLGCKLNSTMINMVFLIIISLLSLLFFGYIPNRSAVGIGTIWSANALALLDSQGLSPVAKQLEKIEPLQWEGFSYIGWSGITTLLLAAGAIFSKEQQKMARENTLFPSPSFYAVVMAGFFLYSLGNPWMAGNHTLLTLPDHIPGLSSFMQTFRSTGRYIWPVYYSLLIWGLVTVSKNFHRPKPVFLLIAILMIESHLPTIKFTKNILKERYEEGRNWEKISLQSNSDELSQIIRGSRLIINASGDPNLKLKSLPQFYIQALNPTAATNYWPYLARMPVDFDRLMSLEPCQLSRKMLDKAEQTFDRNQITLIMADDNAKACEASLGLNKKLSLGLDDGFSLYELRS